MLSRILIVAATGDEAAVLNRVACIESVSGRLFSAKKQLEVLVTGIGTVPTAWALAKKYSGQPKPDLAINIGIAGAFGDELEPGDVVMPVSDCFADAGVGIPGGFLTLAEAGLQDPDEFPFTRGKLIADNNYVSCIAGMVKFVSAVTVNTASGSEENIAMIHGKYQPDIETMEGAAFFYSCLMEKIPFIALRAVSNKVEPRDKKRWNIPLALNNLARGLNDVLLKLAAL